MALQNHVRLCSIESQANGRNLEFVLVIGWRLIGWSRGASDRSSWCCWFGWVRRLLLKVSSPQSSSDSVGERKEDADEWNHLKKHCWDAKSSDMLAVGHAVDEVNLRRIFRLTFMDILISLVFVHSFQLEVTGMSLWTELSCLENDEEERTYDGDEVEW